MPRRESQKTDEDNSEDYAEKNPSGPLVGKGRHEEEATKDHSPRSNGKHVRPKPASSTVLCGTCGLVAAASRLGCVHQSRSLPIIVLLGDMVTAAANQREDVKSE